MRHKWIKRRFRQKIYNGGAVYGDTKECTYCGLRKGYSKDYYGFFPKLVYFDAEKILSSERLPFSCQGEWIGGELPIKKFNETFLEEEEFKV
jgi:hypothetical protein